MSPPPTIFLPSTCLTGQNVLDYKDLCFIEDIWRYTFIGQVRIFWGAQTVLLFLVTPPPFHQQLKLAGAARGVPGDYGHSIVSLVSFFPTILQSQRQVVTNPAVRQGTDLLLVTFSFVLLFAPLFGCVWGPPTQFHRVPCYRCWLAAFPAAYSSAPVLSVVSFSWRFSTWLTENCCRRVVCLEPHIADEQKHTKRKSKMCIYVYVYVYVKII